METQDLPFRNEYRCRDREDMLRGRRNNFHRRREVKLIPPLGRCY